MRSEYCFPFVFSPRVILSVSRLEQNIILGDTDLGEVAEAAPPTSYAVAKVSTHVPDFSHVVA